MSIFSWLDQNWVPDANLKRKRLSGLSFYVSKDSFYKKLQKNQVLGFLSFKKKMQHGVPYSLYLEPLTTLRETIHQARLSTYSS